MAGVSDASYWENLYRSGEDGWELKAPSPPLVRAAGRIPAGEAAIVLGCGRGHEARLLAAAGWRRVVAIDFARPAIEAARGLSAAAPGAERIEWRLADLFELGRGGGPDAGAFDLALEHTCFCAIDPARRAEWAQTVARLLRPGGRLLALFYAHGRPAGPPFTTDGAEVEALLKDAGLAVERTEVPADSIPRRAGEELLVLARRSWRCGPVGRAKK